MRYSILDLSPVAQGTDVGQALRQTRDLAQHAERWGYHRFWIAEHHGIPGVASAATAVLIGYVAEGTQRIRVGSGGIMLPNHAPLVIAEQFGTLAALYPGRIDLGLGRAPGGDQRTMHALRRGLGSSGDTFPQDFLELQRYLGNAQAGQVPQAIPGQGSHVPLYLLGSSTFSARLAAEHGLPFAFASHFAPDYLYEAIRIYRQHFKPSPDWKQPYVMIGVNIFAADTDEEAQYLFTTLQQIFLNMIRGNLQEMPPPVARLDWNAAEQHHVERMTRIAAVGNAQTVSSALSDIIRETQANEIIATSHIFNHRAHLHSFEIAASVLQSLA